MAAPKGNRFWEARSSHGRNPKFGSPDALWQACCEYFAWVDDNPLHETKAFHNQGEIVYAKMAKMRAMTLSGLCIFLDISRSTWTEYTKREDFSNITTRVEQIIYDQKFSGAAADLLNANIIARDLGLKEQTVNDHLSTDGSMSPAKIILVPGGQRDNSED
ncbi:DNA-packaging protein [Xenorhabdus sp. BG5]|uniref:DNA-packaging protein n=1 Tax=Xenorhabdus sp. BG5 TaxID=2782014 RepID=UPI00187E09CF|nr:DNA-packaging protein [Xenorhabdus sp. BG5]MBE8598209.1 DNA-packaging protein [Xenorhabdus sp. BG5]